MCLKFHERPWWQLVIFPKILEIMGERNNKWLLEESTYVLMGALGNEG
jgi:hypothetical protein